MSGRDAILFDLDGCLVDTLPCIVRCWTETLEEFGLPVPNRSAIRANIGPPVHLAARAFAPAQDEKTIEALVASYRQRSAQATDVEAFPGVVELLASVHGRGIPLGIATSKSMEVVEPLLTRLDLARFFDTVEGTRVDELGAAKATVVQRAIARLAPDRATALVGDRAHDVVGAHAHGLSAIGVLWGYGSKAELVAAGADKLVSTPAALGRYLDVTSLRRSPDGPSH